MKKKIIITASQVPFVKGGAELMVDFLQKNLVKRGFDAEIVALPYKWYPEKSLFKHCNSCLRIGKRNVDLLIKASRSENCGIKILRLVRSG